MNKTKIDWPGLDYTWNPITGCYHGCSYCYARKIAMRFTGHFDPILHWDRFDEPFRAKKPARIFVGSMGDMWGDFIRASWINTVLDVIKATPQHEYMFLTKNPLRYLGWFDGNRTLDNVLLGVTMEHSGKEMQPRLNAARQLKKAGNKTFLSAEPLFGGFDGINLDEAFDLVIVGAMTGHGATEPKKEWIDSIRHNNIHYKHNIKPFLK